MGQEQLPSYLRENLGIYIQKELFNEKDSQARIELEQSIQNLYAIIIDTTWYNWMPDIVEKRFGAQFKSKNKNCYICFYNKNHAIAKDGRKIFTQINEGNVYSIEL